MFFLESGFFRAEPFRPRSISLSLACLMLLGCYCEGSEAISRKSKGLLRRMLLTMTLHLLSLC